MASTVLRRLHLAAAQLVTALIVIYAMVDLPTEASTASMWNPWEAVTVTSVKHAIVAFIAANIILFAVRTHNAITTR